MKYECSVCGVGGVRLWREAHFAHCKLFCVACALDHEKEHLGGLDDFGRSLKKHLDCGSLGYLVAARPVDDTFWGHTSGPQSSVDAWCALPFSALAGEEGTP